tara:strand:+ start:3876 stop:4652 length:777 start_codon:yes stop_codon:yes gene_type:complete
MKYDISPILKDWDFNPDEFLARRIKSHDGSEKIQIRIDMGILQLELSGRPDGRQLFDCTSLLEYHLNKIGLDKKKEFTFTEEECEDLFQEAWQFYHRYLSLFYLEEYQGVIKDTEHALKIFDLVDEYAPNDEVRWYFEQYYPHAIMMQTRAHAMLCLESENYPTALQAVKEGIENIETFLEEWDGEGEIEEELPELVFLREWHTELEQERPLTRREQLERALKDAVENEDFEEAARLRDKIQTLWPGPRHLFRPPDRQ